MNGERLMVMEREKDQQAICNSMGGQAVADCMTKCSPEVIASCPLMALKQRQAEMVTVSPSDMEAVSGGDDAGYIDAGGGIDIPRSQPLVVPSQNMPPKPTTQEKEAAKKRAEAERAMRERLRQQSNVPQRQPGQGVQNRTYLELLMDGVAKLVVTDSLRQK